MHFSKWNRIAGWLVFGIAFIVYALTAQRFVMFWDSGEFTASMYKLQATHPPGAPLYTLMGRLFTLFFPAGTIAYAAALFSALFGAFTVWFLYHALVWLAQKITATLPVQGKEADLAVLASAIVGSLSLTFTDSFWVSSTEAEVYTLSTFFMAAVFWAATRWERQFGQAGNDRWLLLMVYLLGLSMGVHILNLAILFPVAMLICLKKFGFSFKSVGIALGAALVLFVLFNSILVKGFVGVLIRLEILAVNSFGWSQHSGALLGIVLFFVLIAIILFWARLKGKFLLERLVNGLLLFTIGWSTYAMAVIRTDADTPASNNAYNVLRLLDYLRSEQFGFSSQALFYGPTFNSPRDGDKEYVNADPVLVYDEEEARYVVTNDGILKKPNYHKESMVFFPRMYSFEPIDVNGYKQWIEFKGKQIPVEIMVNGTRQNVVIPTKGENFSFFSTYQLGWLNFRYFMWNYAGRQNDIKGIGIPSAGNWVSGLPLMDKSRIGPSYNIPEYYKTHGGLNTFYFLPLLLGLLGLFFLFKTAKPELLVTGLFFLAFGVAITIFINQRPIHILIRERDYIFLGSYYIFSLWIGVGVLALFYWLPKELTASRKLALAGAIGLFIPMLMAFKGWDDHDRSKDDVAYKLAKNTLDQCAPNSILVTLGDNIVFPLWYMQEVEGYRTDVRILEYSLLNLHWYIERLQTAVNQSAAVKLGLPKEFYQKGYEATFPLQKNPKIKSYADLNKVLQYIASLKEDRYIPTGLLSLAADTSAINVSSGVEPVARINWQFNKQTYGLADIVLLDLLTQNYPERPVYFTSPQLGLDRYLQDKGLVKQLLPLAPTTEDPGAELVDTEAMHQLLMEDMHFKVYRDTNRFVQGINTVFAYNVYRPAFVKLASVYERRGMLVKSLEVLNRAQEHFPNKNVPYKREMFEMAKLYHKADYIDEWRRISRLVMRNLMEELRWYTSFTPQHELITYTYATKLGEQLSSIMTDIGNRDKILVREIEPELNKLRAQYDNWVFSNPVMSRRHLGQ